MAQRPTPTSPDLNQPNGDQQSIEKLKQSAGYILGAIVLILAGYFGWSYLQSSGMKTDTVAADKYSAIETANETVRLAQAEDGEAGKKLNSDIDALVAEHGSTIYAWQALMIKARNAVDAGDHETALDALKKAKEIKLNDAGLESITQLRYATILLANGDIDAAMTEASRDVPVPFEATQQELLGDIYVAQKENDKAVRAYENAWSLLSKRNEERAILRLKLESMGVNPEPIEPRPEIVKQTAAPEAMTEDIAQDENDDALLEDIGTDTVAGTEDIAPE